MSEEKSKFDQIVDETMEFVYSRTLSLADWIAVTIISDIVSTYSYWWALLYIPWIIYSSKQKQKYDSLQNH